MRSISPELVLVDPELTALARELLPDAPDCLAPRERLTPLSASATAVELEPVGADTTAVEALTPPAVDAGAVPTEAIAPVPAHAAVASVALAPTALTPTVPAHAAVASVAPAPTAPVHEVVAPPAPAPAPPLRAPVLPPPVPVVVERLPAPAARRRKRHIPVALALSWLVAGAAVASPFLAFLPPPESEVPVLETMAPSPRPTPQATQRVTTPRAVPRPDRTPPVTQLPARPIQRAATGVVLRWPADARAMFYDVILVRGDKRLDLWPTRNRIELQRGESAAAETYTWFAYPAYRTGSGVRYGELLAHGDVTVAAGSVKGQERPAITRGG